MTRKTTQILLTTLDAVRMEAGLQLYPATKVIVVYAKKSVLEDKRMRGMKNMVESILRRFSFGSSEDQAIDGRESFVAQIDFYDLVSAVTDLYVLVKREVEKDSDVIINVSGGTRVIAIASVLVSMLLDNCKLVYFLPKKYNDKGLASVISETPLEVDLPPLAEGAVGELSANEIRTLESLNEPATTVKEALLRSGFSPEEGSGKVPTRYYHIVDKLRTKGLVVRTLGGLERTQWGDIVSAIHSVESGMH